LGRWGALTGPSPNLQLVENAGFPSILVPRTRF
jgi:hypothetical protein